MTRIQIFALVPYLALGVATGGVYLALLRRSLPISGTALSWGRIALHSVVRVAAVGLVLWLAARSGAGPLLSTFAGFLLARFAAMFLLPEAR